MARTGRPNDLSPFSRCPCPPAPQHLSMTTHVFPAFSAHAPAPRHDRYKAACSNCGLRELCLPRGVSQAELPKLDAIVALRRHVPRAGVLFRHGEALRSLYAVHTGFFKRCMPSHNGRDQVTGFPMPGELLGLDGLATEQHHGAAVALTPSLVCVIPIESLEAVMRESEDLRRQFNKLMSREIVREHDMMLLLGTARAEVRLAAFLLNLAQRLELRGGSPTDLTLWMTREEIGSHLGLKLETVSRTFSRLQDEGLMEVRHRHIRLLDRAGLGQLVHGARR